MLSKAKSIILIWVVFSYYLQLLLCTVLSPNAHLRIKLALILFTVTVYIAHCGTKLSLSVFCDINLSTGDKIGIYYKKQCL